MINASSLEAEIEKVFIKYDGSQHALKALMETKQGTRSTGDYLTWFTNKKSEAHIGSDFTMHILIKNAAQILFEQAVRKHRVPRSYEDLCEWLQTAGRMEDYLQVV